MQGRGTRRQDVARGLAWMAAFSASALLVVPKGLSVFATLMLLVFVVMQTSMLFDKVRLTRIDNVLTYDLNLPTWPFYAVAWTGDFCAVILIVVRTWRLIFAPEKLHDEGYEQVHPDTEEKN